MLGTVLDRTPLREAASVIREPWLTRTHNWSASNPPPHLVEEGLPSTPNVIKSEHYDTTYHHPTTPPLALERAI